VAGVAVLARTQGFRLSVSTQGGAGRTLLRRVAHFNHVTHLLTLKSFSATRLLRVFAYEVPVPWPALPYFPCFPVPCPCPCPALCRFFPSPLRALSHAAPSLSPRSLSLPRSTAG